MFDMQFQILCGASRTPGRYDIENHIQSARHKKANQAVSKASIKSFFKHIDATNDELQSAAKEATFAYHTAIHGLTFRMSDCTAKLIKKFLSLNIQELGLKRKQLL